MVSGTFGRTHWQVLCSKGSSRLLQTDAHRPFHHKSQVQMTESHRRYQNHRQLQQHLVESVKVAPPTISEDWQCLVQLHLNTVGTKTQVLSLLSNICNIENYNFTPQRDSNAPVMMLVSSRNLWKGMFGLAPTMTLTLCSSMCIWTHYP